MRYKQLAEKFIEDIQHRRLQPGQRLPSLRRLAAQYEVSLTTALNCYHRLEELGWARAQPQSGFFAAQPLLAEQTPHLPTFTSRTADPIATHNRRHVTEPGPLGLSLLASTLLPTAALQRSLRRASRQQGAQVHLYPQAQGELALRRALSKHFSRYDFHFSEQALVVTNGCIDAVRTAIEVTTRPGDAVAISSPCFSGLLQLLAQMQRQVVEIPSTAEGIDLRQLERHMQQGSIQAGLFNCSHMNPTGITLSADQKQQLAQLAARYRVPVIEDDIYLELGYQRTPPVPAQHWDREGYLLWCGSVSKTLSAGYRLGWCLPGRYFEAYQQQRLRESYGVSSPIQLAVADFISSDQYHRHLNALRPQLARQVADYRDYMIANLPDTVRISAPQGGLVLWIQLPGLDSVALAQQAERQNLDIRIGADFSTLDYYADCFRINCGWPLNDAEGQPSTASEQLGQLVKLVLNNWTPHSG